jgi:hypothetical protein
MIDEESCAPMIPCGSGLVSAKFTQPTASTLLVITFWSGSAQVFSVTDAVGSTFTAVSPVRHSPLGSFVAYAAANVMASTNNAVHVTFNDGVPNEAAAWFWRLPPALGTLLSETGTTGAGQGGVRLAFPGASSLRMVLASCWGCFGSGLAVGGSPALGPSDTYNEALLLTEQAILALEPPIAGDLLVQTATANAGWVMDVMIFGP